MSNYTDSYSWTYMAKGVIVCGLGMLVATYTVRALDWSGKKLSSSIIKTEDRLERLEKILLKRAEQERLSSAEELQ